MPTYTIFAGVNGAGKTSKGENIDIEVQLTDQGNMDKRTLFYWGKMYLENIKQGQDYTSLEK